jgi:hypothetical protein
MNLLHIGTLPSGDPMTLPADLGDKKIALVAQSKKGKTYGLGVILEELCKAKRPFIATDPANNLWGLRVRPDGSPSGLPVVVIGGPHGDIPIEKDAGERVAEALLATPQCAVIDLSMESQGAKRRFMTAFAERLMRTRCPHPLPIFLEEAPDLIPQKALGPQIAICKAAVSKLATIGGNFGYGVFPATQRPATIDKDVLSQCEALIVMGMTHAADRQTVADWVDAKDIGGRVDAMFAELGSLQPGEAWLWWPGEERFERFTFRKRETLHPRDMGKLGLKPAHVQLGDAAAFVERLKKDLARTQVTGLPEVDKKPIQKFRVTKGLFEGPAQTSPPSPRGETVQVDQFQKLQAELVHLRNEVSTLNQQLGRESELRRDAERRLKAVRARLQPEYDNLRALFEDLGQDAAAGGAAQDLEAWKPWFEKAAVVGCRRVLELLVQRGRLKQVQLATLAGVKYGGSTWRAYRSWMIRNSLAKIEGDEIAAAVLA